MSARRRLFLSHITHLDWLIAIEFGSVDDGQPPDHWVGVCDEVGYLLDRPGGEVVGFKVLEFSSFEPTEEVERELTWPDAPRFDVPVLGLVGVTAGEVIYAAKRFFGDEQSINREFFDRATECGAAGLYEQALHWWRSCLMSGDAMAHFGIGYTLHDLGRAREGLPYLRHYTDLAPHEPWNWVWRGKAEQAVGLLDAARDSYTRALQLERGEETEAEQLLDELGVEMAEAEREG